MLLVRKGACGHVCVRECTTCRWTCEQKQAARERREALRDATKHHVEGRLSLYNNNIISYNNNNNNNNNNNDDDDDDDNNNDDYNNNNNDGEEDDDDDNNNNDK